MLKFDDKGILSGYTMFQIYRTHKYSAPDSFIGYVHGDKMRFTQKITNAEREQVLSFIAERELLEL